MRARDNKKLLKTGGVFVFPPPPPPLGGGGGGGGERGEVGNHPSLYVPGLRHQKTPSRKQSQHAFFTISSSLNLQFPNATTKYTIIFPMLPVSLTTRKS